MSQVTAVTLLSRRFPAKRAFITGGGSGLGLALAEILARDGWALGLFERSAESLQRATEDLRALGARVTGFCGDVADPAAVSDAVESFDSAHDGLDVMVNNAGVAVAAPVEGTPVEDWRWIVDINLLGVAWGCRAVLPVLRRRGTGLILNVASSAAFAAAPQMSAYNATKAGVVALSETLAAELADTQIQVTVAMPGFFRTHLLDRLRAPPAQREMAHRLMDRSRHGADRAAAALLEAAAKGRLYVVWPREYAIAWRLKRWFPLWFLGRLQALRDAQVRRAGPPPA
jgi:NAD(P)-dependent dehydrogenase (short-subunit alcohol dehydrogenase family)